MTPLASTPPSNDGYVAAAYIVFFALLLVYLTIMGIRVSRMERRLRALQERNEQAPPQPHDGSDGAAVEPPREREIV